MNQKFVSNQFIDQKIKYWCCPDCGHQFWRNLTGSSGEIHYCPANPGVMVVVAEPKANGEGGDE